MMMKTEEEKKRLGRNKVFGLGTFLDRTNLETKGAAKRPRRASAQEHWTCQATALSLSLRAKTCPTLRPLYALLSCRISLNFCKDPSEHSG